MITDENKNSALDIVNPQYWYDDDDNLLVLLALLKKNQLTLSNQSQGIILKTDGSLHTIDGFSFSLSTNLLVSNDIENMRAKLDIVTAEISKIKQWNELQLSNNNPSLLVEHHKILLPLNLNNVHWVAFEITLKFVKCDDSFYIDKFVTTNIYDSTSISKGYFEYIDILNKNLRSFLENFSLTGKLLYENFLVTTKRQMDMYSCSPITCKTIVDLIHGHTISKSSDSYTKDAIKSLRLEQIEAVNDPAFVAKQQNFVPATLPAKQVNSAALTLTELLYEYIDQINDPLTNDVFKIMQELIAADNKIQDVAYSDILPTAAQFEAMEQNYKEKLSNVKSWFSKHYESLRELDLLQYFFKDKLPEAELEWIDNGKDTLVEVLKKMLNISQQTDHSEHTQQIAPIQIPDPLDGIIISHIQKVVSPNGAMAIYECNGSIQTWSEQLGEFYTYDGPLMNGIKVGYGVERFTHNSLNITARFTGKRDLNGNMLDGSISCFIGDMMVNGYYLFAEGILKGGKFNTWANLYMLDEKELLGPIRVVFNGGFPEEIKFPTSEPEYKSNFLEFARNCIGMKNHDQKRLEKLMNSFSIIVPHIVDNADNLMLALPPEENLIAAVRAIVLEKYSRKPSPALVYSPKKKSFFYESNDFKTIHDLASHKTKEEYKQIKNMARSKKVTY